MAETSTTFSPPSVTMKTELWYKVGSGTLTQVFGVQSIPSIITTAEDITYRTLESTTEFSLKGVRAYESIEIECIGYPEQFKTMKALGDADEMLDWYVKLPDSFKGTGDTKAVTVHWQGGLDVSLAEISLDDMIKTTIKIGKTTVPEIIDGLPTT